MVKDKNPLFPHSLSLKGHFKILLGNILVGQTRSCLYYLEQNTMGYGPHRGPQFGSLIKKVYGSELFSIWV